MKSPVTKSKPQFEYTLTVLPKTSSGQVLGNARVSFADLDKNDTIDPNTEILQTQSYYPFGLTHSGLQSPQSGKENLYQYNGKELQLELGLLDYGARMYDASIGRWGVVDPLAEIYMPTSPFNYVLNNPIIMVDPTGMATYDSIEDIAKDMDNIESGTTFKKNKNGQFSDGNEDTPPKDIYYDEDGTVKVVKNDNLLHNTFIGTQHYLPTPDNKFLHVSDEFYEKWSSDPYPLYKKEQELFLNALKLISKGNTVNLKDLRNQADFEEFKFEYQINGKSVFLNGYINDFDQELKEVQYSKKWMSIAPSYGNANSVYFFILGYWDAGTNQMRPGAYIQFQDKEVYFAFVKQYLDIQLKSTFK